MVLRMARPSRRPRSSFIQYRERVPADVLKVARGQQVTISFPAETADVTGFAERRTVGAES
jgi:hypothetical protein